ncbi:hypothetical protein ANO11243_055890 [Dothideomycetidae sp. 11243]|nr:hypothetical protein ANO11243_055890 [fungal sp. No.11243]
MADLPKTMRIWQYASVKGGLENNLKLNTQALPAPEAGHHLVRITNTSLNPVDYKPAKIPIAGRFLVPKQATPAIDISARIVAPAQGSKLKAGQLVWGVAAEKPFAPGGLGEYANVPEAGVLPIPEGVDPIHAAALPVAGLSAYQSIVPHVKSGDHVFLNGGSGGVGIFVIQMAKAVGCHVTTTCSERNVELCKFLGADEVVDYTKGDLIETLVNSDVKFDHVVDNVGGDDSRLYWECHRFTKPGAKFVLVGATPGLAHTAFKAKTSLWRGPGAAEGGKRPLLGFFAHPVPDDMQQMVDWVKEGKVKVIIDSTFPFEEAVEAYKKLRTGSARGKIIVLGSKD